MESSSMKMAWLLGWAIPVEWFSPLVRKIFPNDEHCFVLPQPDAIAQLERESSYDWVVGYSLGSHLLLMEPDRVSRLGRIALLAPIFAFAQEENLGGRVTRTQLKYLSRRLRHDRAGALKDFYMRAGLDLSPDVLVSSTLDQLLWGLEALGSARIEPPLPSGWMAWCGANDLLLDAARLSSIASVRTVLDGGH